MIALALTVRKAAVVGVAWLAILALADVATSTGPHVPNSWLRGANVTGYYPRDVFASKATDRTLATLRGDGANAAEIVLECWMRDASSTSISCSDAETMSDGGVRHALARARALGMRAILKPHVDSHDNAFRGSIAPLNWHTWFASYRSMMNYYADLARQSGAWGLVVGTELTSAQKCMGCNAEWHQTIAEIRARFHGKLTYAANVEDLGSFPAWATLDYIGDDGYFELAGPRQADPGVDGLVRAWSSFRDQYGVIHHWLSLLRAVTRRYHKPLLFTEFGYESQAGAAAFFSRQLPDRLALQAQAHAYEAAMRVFRAQPWFAGMLLWNYQVDHPVKGNEIDFDPRGKPAQDVLRAWWR